MTTAGSKPKGSTWTDDQWSAISTHGQDILVAAAAGSGKTAVLVERIIRRVSSETEPIDVDRLLVATFTNAAAAEMRQRIREALEQELARNPGSDHLRRQLALLNRASITTLHSFCLEVVHRYFQTVQLDPTFRIVNETEAELMRQEVLEQLFEDYYGGSAEDSPFWNMVEWFGGERSDYELFKLVQRLYDYSRSHSSPDYWLQEMADAYKCSDLETFTTNNGWYHSLVKDIQLELSGVIGLLRQALRLAELPNGPAPYIENLQDDLTLAEYLLEVTHHHTWDHVYHAFQASGFGKLKACKGDDIDKQLQEQVKGLRDQAKKALSSVKDELFQRTPEQYMMELNEMAPVMDMLVELVKAFGERYKQAKAEKGLVDFADLEHYCLQILSASDSTPSHLIPSQAALEYREQFAEVLLDEYQDTNMVQEAIVALISKPAPGNRFMVGDVKQSIYRFRLAEPGLFLAKYKAYRHNGDVKMDAAEGTVFTFDSEASAAVSDIANSAAAEMDLAYREAAAAISTDSNAATSHGLRIDLARNFRSRQEIVDGVNFIFKQIMDENVAEIAYDRRAELVCGAQYPDYNGQKDLAVQFMLIDRSHSTDPDDEEHGDRIDQEDDQPGSDSSQLEPFQEAKELETAQLEARLIAAQIRRLMGMEDEPPFMVFDKKAGGQRIVTYRDIVILLRATQQWAPVLIEELRLAGIPAYADLNTGYFTAMEVEMMMSLLQVIDNPLQEIPLAAVLRSPIYGLSAEEMALIRIQAKHAAYYEAVVGYASMEQPPDAGLQAKLRSVIAQLESWRSEARQGSLADLIWRIYRETGLYDLVGGMPGGIQRQANLRALYDRAKQYESTSFRGLFRFLRFIERMRDSGGDLGAARALGEQEDVVRIMSIHKSKGLEFPVVFVAGIGKLFNQQDMRGQFLMHKQLGFGAKFVDTKLRVSYPTLPSLAIKQRIRMETLAEEMRILYVALTRPKEKMFLLGTVKNLEKQLQSWEAFVTHNEWMLPDYSLAKARSYLDWIGRALIRHPNADLLRITGGMKDAAPSIMREEPSKWRFTIIPQESLNQAAAVQEAADPATLHALSSLQPVDQGAGDYSEQIRTRLEWCYPFAESQSYFAKTSVSELKRMSDRMLQQSEHDEEGWSVPVLVQEAGAGEPVRKPVFRRPRFMEQRQMTAAERGTVYHTIMQHMPLQNGVTPQDVETTMERMIGKQLLTQDQKEAVDAAVIHSFFAGSLGQRLVHAQQVYRELPFSYGLPAQDVYPVNDEETKQETILIQGVIDCLFEEDDALVLVDFKTDAVYGDIERISERYRLQLDLYAKAIESIWNKPVKEKYLYFFDGAHVVRM